MSIAVYPGSFDPVTLGHLNIIKRAVNCFDHVVVCVMVNSEKDAGLFTPEERVELIRRTVSHIDGVEVEYSSGLLSDYCEKKGANVVVKGLRAISDYEKEVQMALINRHINPNVDTLFLPSGEKYTYLSSSVVKEMAAYGTNLEGFVPDCIIEDIEEKMKQRREE